MKCKFHFRANEDNKRFDTLRSCRGKREFKPLITVFRLAPMNINDLAKSQEKLAKSIEEANQEDGTEDISEGRVIQFVSFSIDEVEYGIDILRVHEILRIPDITRLPNTPYFIRGVINLRGNVIPVVDIRERFGFPSIDITEFTRIIVVETESKLIGLYVDNVSQVIRINESNIDPSSDLIEGVSEEFISGVGRLKEKLIVLLNLENILFDNEGDRAVS
jgi:purine-binding chemotaxis protein CheW